MEKKLKLEEIYECIALLGGFSNPMTQSTVVGFGNEKGISEGMRRISNKTLKKLNENWPTDQIKTINELKEDSLSSPVESEKVEEALVEMKKAKIKELLNSEATIIFEELPDFLLLDKRLEDRKEQLSHNYTYIFERIFLNY